MPPFQLEAPFRPCGDQGQAIDKLVAGIAAGRKHQTLLGVTGSGKTFTMANVIERMQRPTLVICHNKTLAAQLSRVQRIFSPQRDRIFRELLRLLPAGSLYSPERTLILKRTRGQRGIDQLRHAATRPVKRRDVLIVASVSCIYGLGSPDFYRQLRVSLKKGDVLERDSFLRQLVSVQYSRNDVDFSRGTFRARGDVVEIFPPRPTSDSSRVFR